MVETYKHSGSSGGLGVPLVAFASVVSAVVLGFIYCYAINYIPFIYLNLFIAIGFGLGLGFAVAWAATVGKMRNTMLVSVLGFLAGVGGLYVAWAVDPMARSEGELPMMFNPSELWEYIGFFYDKGFWSIGSGDDTVSGVFLGIVWLVEAGVIVGGSTLLAMACMADQPFCEVCNGWTNSEEAVACLAPTTQYEPQFERILDGDLSGMHELMSIDDSLSRYLRFDLAICPTCNESNFLTISVVSQSVDKDGELKTDTTELIKNMIISESDTAIVRAGGFEPLPPDDTDEEPEEGPTTFPELT
jgi:hypothetical protein